MRPGYFEDLTDAEIDLIIDVHLRGAFYVTRPVWKIMQKQCYGRVVMTGSSSGMFSHQGVSSYAAAKGGLYGLTKALAFEGHEHGIHVNMNLPGAATTIDAEHPVPRMQEYWLPEVFELLAPGGPPKPSHR